VLGFVQEGTNTCVRQGAKTVTKFEYHMNKSRLENLSQRRKITRICVLFKAYSGERAWKAISDKLQRPNYRSRVDHEKKIRNGRQRTDIGKDFFMNRTIKVWNWLLAGILGLSPVILMLLERGVGK
jgi:hypothetical protein